MLRPVVVEGLLAPLPDEGGGAGIDGRWGVASESAVAVFGGVAVQKPGGPVAGMVDAVEQGGQLRLALSTRSGPGAESSERRNSWACRGLTVSQ
jgi:hypothetical protein